MRLAVLSPHRDDAAFSCGLLLTHLLHAGSSAALVNVCTVSDYAPYLPESEEPRVEQVSRERLAEDRRFLQELQAVTGEVCSLTDLGWLDSPLRLGIATDTVLDARGTDPVEVERLAAELAPWAEFDAVLAPLGLGHHIDHRLVHEAARNAIAPEKLGFYQDLPYACWRTPEERAAQVHERLQGMEGLSLWNAPGIEHADTLKQTYALCYPTQIAPDLAALMAADAANHNGSECMHLPQILAAKFTHGLNSRERRTVAVS